MRRRWLFLMVLSWLLAAATGVSWITSYRPSADTRYTGWWCDCAVPDSTRIGLRFFDCHWLVWKWQTDKGKPWSRDEHKVALFQFFRGTDSCWLESGVGIPWTAHPNPRFAGASAISAPIWSLLLPIVAAFCWSFKKMAHERRLARPGRCHACGYDLFGNVSGICPECGRPTRRVQPFDSASSSAVR
jgi:hypothetical protein